MYTTLDTWLIYFRKLKLTELSAPHVPSVGLFWNKGKCFYHEGTPLSEACWYGECLIHDGAHYDAWQRAVAANPAWGGFEYEQVPRGRVTFHWDPMRPEFMVYIPKELISHKTTILSAFLLPAGFTRFDTSDEHYRV